MYRERVWVDSQKGVAVMTWSYNAYWPLRIKVASIDQLVTFSVEQEVVWDGHEYGIGILKWQKSRFIIEPDSICYYVKTTTENLVVQARHMTSLLYHFRNKTLPLVMRPDHSPLSLVVFLLLPQEGSTALMWASVNGHANVVEKLLAAGANLDHQDNVRNLVTRVMLIHVSFLMKSLKPL